MKGFEGGPSKKVTMEEWKEVMPRMINQIKDEQTRKAFLDSILKIYKKFEEQGGVFPSHTLL